MSNKNWAEILNWGEDQFDDLRYAGYAYIRQGKYDIALPFFRALVILDPTTAYNLHTLGALYLELREPKLALKYLRKALRYDPNNECTLVNISKALFTLGQKGEALEMAEHLSTNAEPHIASIAKALLIAHG